jgi:iron complex transport system substrate-binding protein
MVEGWLKKLGAVQRVVSLSPGATESLYAIGAAAQIAAVDNNADYPAEAQAFEPKVDAFQPNVEAIAALDPDLVIVASNIDGIVEALDRLEVPVLYTDLDTDMQRIDDVQGQIALLGRLTGRVDAAQEVIKDMQTRVQAVEEQLVGLSNTRGPSVYHELDSTFYSVSEDTFIGNLYRTLKARNIAGDGGGIAYPQLTQEAIIAANPDIIVLADEEFGVTIDSVKARPGWGVISAVQNDRIYGIDPDIISRPGPRIVDALEELARNFYPEVFG